MLKWLKNYQQFIPKSVDCLKWYTFPIFKKDLMAGVTVGIVSLPLAMAFAMASGVPPEKGLFTAVVAGFLIALLGGSRVQIGGPTGAFVVVIYGVVQRHGFDGLLMATLIAGVMLVIMGLLRLGTLIKYIPHPLTVGFTTGIALVVFSAQLKDLLGLQILNLPVHFIDKWSTYFDAAPTYHVLTTILGLTTLAFIILLRRYFPKAPWGIISIVLATLICWAFHLETPTIGTRFGTLPSTLPHPHFYFKMERFLAILPDAIAIALLAGIESLISAVIADAATGGRHKPNCELVAQGLANIGAAAFGGMPATAAIARTATNIRTGAQTPIAGMLHAITLFLLLLTCAPIVSHIPLAALSAILVVVAWNMSELPHFIRLMKTSHSDVAILLTAFFLTVFVDLTAAVGVGVLLAAFFFMKRMSDVKPVLALDKSIPEQSVEIYQVHGPFFFGVTDRMKDLMHGHLPKPPSLLIFRMGQVPLLDATALQTLRELSDRYAKHQSRLVLTEVRPELVALLHKYGLGDLLETK